MNTLCATDPGDGTKKLDVYIGGTDGYTEGYWETFNGRQKMKVISFFFALMIKLFLLVFALGFQQAHYKW